jgi:hypothetical protein
MRSAVWIKDTEQTEEMCASGSFGFLNPGSGGPSFSVNRTATVHYWASGSTFNIYIGNNSQLNANDTGAFSYIADLSVQNATSADVTGTIEAGDYGILIVNIGDTNESVTFSYEITYPVHHAYDDWFPWIMLSLAVVVIISIGFVVLTWRKRDT